MYIYNLTTEQYEKEINVGRLIILGELYNKGIIEEDVYKEYAHDYCIVIRKPSFFSRFWKTFYKDDKERYILVKQMSLIEHDENEEDGKPDLKIVKFDKEET